LGGREMVKAFQETVKPRSLMRFRCRFCLRGDQAPAMSTAFA
jgi:hypothetical protein